MFRPTRTTGQALLTALMVSGVAGYTLAQGDSAATVDVVKIDPVGQSGEEAPLSPGQRLSAAESAVASASASCSAQSGALQSATRDGDIIRATCLEDKLNRCNANLQNIKRRQTSLKEATAEGDTGRAQHEYTVIRVLSQKFRMLAQAANQCVGQDLFDTGDTQIRGEVDLFAPDENPTVVAPVPDWPIPYIPPPVSGVS